MDDGVSSGSSVTSETPSQTASSESLVSVSSTASSPLIQPSPTETSQSTTSITPSSPALASSPPSSESVNGLDTGVKIGIGVVVGIFGAALIAYLVEIFYLRRRRRERALERAVEEVERGEMSTPNKTNDDIRVLESRVSIVFDDVSGSEDEEPERGRTRNGLSLPRRVY